MTRTESIPRSCMSISSQPGGGGEGKRALARSQAVEKRQHHQRGHQKLITNNEPPKNPSLRGSKGERGRNSWTLINIQKKFMNIQRNSWTFKEVHEHSKQFMKHSKKFILKTQAQKFSKKELPSWILSWRSCSPDSCWDAIFNEVKKGLKLKNECWKENRGFFRERNDFSFVWE